jgi:UDP-N-acetyl-D-mannosaminuronic acid dehydrogenase
VGSQQDFRKYDVCVYGLGFVGLTLAVILAESGLKVIGLDKNIEVINKLKCGLPHFSEQGLPELLIKHLDRSLIVSANEKEPISARVHIIAVGTPLDSDQVPRLDFVSLAAHTVAKNLMEGDLVIVRSTVYVGASRTLIKPILDTAQIEYSLTFCPERTLEGRALEELTQLPQICSGLTEFDRERAIKFFSKYNNNIELVSSLETAEFIKLVDNTFRDVSFGFANEIELIGHSYGIDPYEAISIANNNYPRTNIPLPGPVGGPCLSKDPYILGFNLDKKEIEFASTITMAARRVNENYINKSMETISKIIKTSGCEADEISIVVLGAAFKGSPQTSDIRNSLSLITASKMLESGFVKSVSVLDETVISEEILSLGFNYIQKFDEIMGSLIVCLIGHHGYQVEKNFKELAGFAHNFGGRIKIITFWGSKGNELVTYFQGIDSIEIQNIFGKLL